MIDTESIRTNNPLPSIAAARVKLQRVGNEWKGPCIFHDDRSPSFTIYAGGKRFYCFGCGASGDVIDFVARVYGVSFHEAARMLGAGDCPTTFALTPNEGGQLHARKGVQKPQSQDAALSIWSRAVEAAGTTAEAYLAFRGINPPIPPDIRFLRLPCDNLGPLPCLVAAVRNVAGDLTGVQRIWLAHDGLGKAEVPKPKRSLGVIKGGAIRLSDLDGSGAVTVCEGPEDGLSLLEMLGGPVWVAAGASFLPAMQFPLEVRSVVIAADNDKAGQGAARNAAQAFGTRGLVVRIIRPLPTFKDFDDELRGAY